MLELEDYGIRDSILGHFDITFADGGGAGFLTIAMEDWDGTFG